MANSLFVSAKAGFLGADFDLLADVVKVTLGDSADVVPAVATHDFYNDVEIGQVAVATLASKTGTGGTFDAADPTFTAVTGDPSEWVVAWVDTAGLSSTDPLVAYYDTFSSGMPVTPNGGDIVLQIHASGLFSL